MYLLTQPAVTYADPWLFPFAERLRRARQGQYRVAYLYEHPDNSTFRYRIYNMIQALSPLSEISATYFTGSELNALSDELEHIDVLVVGRYPYNHHVNRVITKARDYGKRVFFDVDDLIFDIDYTQLVVTSLDQDLEANGVWECWFAYIGRAGATLKLCDAAITTNAFLAEHIRRFFGRPVAVIPNFMNREQLEISQRIYKEKQMTGFARDGRLHLGYFSGTPTHNRDLGIASDALARMLTRHKDVVLRIVGYMELPGPLRDLGDRIERVGFQDFINLQRQIGEVEVNLMPLQDNEFTNCKSELKYFEAGIVGTASIASPVFTYRRGIQDGVNGYLAREHEWDAKLEQALGELGNCRPMIEKAYEDCERRFSWNRQTALIAETLFSSRLTIESAEG